MARKETFGARVKRLREAAGLSQADFAAKARIPVGSLKNWEQGIRQPAIGAAVRIAVALGISLEEFRTCAY